MCKITLEEYNKARQLLNDYKVCGNWCGRDSGSGCNKVFKTEETNRTVGYGQAYYWCANCYTKDD